MSVYFDVWIDGDDFSVDMNAGLETFRGASEVTRKVAGTLLTEKVPKQLTSDSKVRTKLRKNFKGSFIQTFTLELEDPELQSRFRKIGKVPFTELVSYFVHEALYKESPELSQKASKALDNLGDDLAEELIEELRVSALSHLHSVATHFNKDVKLRYRQNRTDHIVLAKLDRGTGSTLRTCMNPKVIELEASITRLNINTGNGRLQIKGASETIAFGFPQQVKFIEQNKALKQKLSDNLHVNNGLGSDRDKWKTLKLRASTQTTSNGRIIKYIVQGILDA
ncbi:hypothetical protein QNE50_001713 [Vibrio parahaemolyticus]|uniref:hypothetical protein n=1 Tax=Vibrio TaxID=662 RepID=UPI000E0C82E8|nr:hypothetical protein [Vibrio cholerae]EGQ8526794.1 hypothetical protein [Vibrio parahaemolyticus]HAS8107829.1 hypothetical protein [Vibrio vulnificus]EGQ9210242.1 hypothetical protein [Vibrio parahaemolyticus]EGQ9787213.1 hypothetical protein [Vibrio parahaemolyticus]EGQ9836363.1 hypothetical protein [Vibrio cholerae]